MDRRSILGAVVGGIAVLASREAFAHAKLLLSVPAKDAQGASPAEIVLTFSEAVIPATVRLTDQGGTEIKSLGVARPGGSTLHVPVTAKLAPGRYTLTYRVAGADTHAINGILTFVVTGP